MRIFIAFILVLILFFTVGCAGSSITYTSTYTNDEIKAIRLYNKGIEFAKEKKWQQALNEYNIYMAFGCQGKNHPIDRKTKNHE